MRKKIIIIALNLLAMLIIVLAFTLLWVPGWLNEITGHDQRVVVPAVVGTTADEAITALEGAGLRPMVIDTVYSDGCQPGEVIEQLPEGNLPVKPNRIVYLTVNAYDVQKVTFPDVVQWSSRQAQSLLTELRFVADSVVYEPYEFDDLVLRVTDMSGTHEMVVGGKYPVRTHVILHIGSTKTEEVLENEELENSQFE